MAERDDDNGLTPLAAGTEEYLQDAKKGKPRSFLLVCKGPKVHYLAVRKKPVKQKDLVEAKKQGYKGEGYFGLITGKGLELVFNLARSDGYDSAPVKDKTLKDFLEEHAEFKCKPTIEITDAPPCAFGDDQLQVPVVARFMQLEPQTVVAKRAYPDRAQAILSLTDEVRELLVDENYGRAEQRLNELEQLMLSLSNSGSASTSSTIESPPGSDAPPVADAPSEDLAPSFKLRLAELKPAIDKALLGDDAQNIKSQMVAIVGLARQQQFGQALSLLEQLAGTLASSTSASSSSPSSTPNPSATATPTPTMEGDLSQSFLPRLKALKPQIDQWLLGSSNIVAEVKQLTAQAAAAARLKDFAAAHAALDQLEQLFASQPKPQADSVDSSPSPSSVPPVDAATFIARFKSMKPELDKALASSLPLAAEIKTQANEVAVLARQKDFSAASEKLDVLEDLLRRLANSDQQAAQVNSVTADELLGLWRDAKDAVDEQLNSFVSALKETGDEYLVRVAGGGLQGFVEGPTRIFVLLQAALFDLKRANADSRTVAINKLIDTATSAANFISQNRFIDVCDANVLCGPLTIRETLLSSLNRIRADAARLAV